MTQVKVKRLTPDAIIPTYGTAGAACFDIATTSDTHLLGIKQTVFDTGLSFEIPKAHVMLVFSRSGHGFKNDVRLSNCVGVIDEDYRGELKVKLINEHLSEDLVISKGDRIAQGMVLPIEQVSFVEVDELSDTARGTGGFGSTGVQ